jgi:hypothetical protein
MGRCATFVGLLIGCYEGEDGSSILRSNPSLNCDEISGRVATGAALTALYVMGLPALMFLLAVKFRCSSFKSELSTFLVRSIFSGHKTTFAAMCYRILTMLRTLGFTVITQTRLSGQRQAVASLLLVTLTLVVESIVEPRTNRAMSLLDRFEEVVLLSVICLGMLGSGRRVFARTSFARRALLVELCSSSFAEFHLFMFHPFMFSQYFDQSAVRVW